MREVKLLLVEDDEVLGNVLKQYLGLKGFVILLAGSGEEGLRIFREHDPDLCILDIMLPGMSGLELGQKIKKKYPDQPIVFLTAMSSKEDILKGLKLGADDYICKPFEPEELVLRVNNILKRSGRVKPEVIRLGEFVFIPEKLELSGYNSSNRLTLKEAELLRYLIENRGVLLKREDILIELWGEDDYFLGRSLDVFISRLRKYLKPEPDVNLETIRGVGYILKDYSK